MGAHLGCPTDLLVSSQRGRSHFPPHIATCSAPTASHTRRSPFAQFTQFLPLDARDSQSHTSKPTATAQFHGPKSDRIERLLDSEAMLAGPKWTALGNPFRNLALQRRLLNAGPIRRASVRAQDPPTRGYAFNDVGPAVIWPLGNPAGFDQRRDRSGSQEREGPKLAQKPGASIGLNEPWLALSNLPSALSVHDPFHLSRAGRTTAASRRAHHSS